MNRNLKKYQISIRRSADGKVLGVFQGIAESLGRSVKGTRIIGSIILLTIAGAFGVQGLVASCLAAGFFYLLLAMLMRPPLANGDWENDSDREIGSAYLSREQRRDRATAPHYSPAPFSQKVDLMQLDRQLDGLNRRIQRMESIVTDRQYDWDRRMNS